MDVVVRPHDPHSLAADLTDPCDLSVFGVAPQPLYELIGILAVPPASDVGIPFIEAIHPGRAVDATVRYLNRRRVRAARRVVWVILFGEDRADDLIRSPTTDVALTRTWKSASGHGQELRMRCFNSTC